MNPTYMLPKNLSSIEMHYIGNLRVVLTLTLQPDLSQTSSLREKCPNTDIFLSIFSRIRTENGPKKKSVFGQFPRSACYVFLITIWGHQPVH